MAVTARLPDLRRLNLGRESFAASSPLALFDGASYPVSVRQPAASFPASFSTPVTLGALRFPWIVTTNSPEDFHLQVIRHAGHTTRKPPAPAGAEGFVLPLTGAGYGLRFMQSCVLDTFGLFDSANGIGIVTSTP
jgi:hypothetical protein